jgi:hypothetical protein
MGQLGFFDLSRRYEGLDVKDDPLVAIAAMVPWESLRPKLKASLITGGLRAADLAAATADPETGEITTAS